MNVARRIIWIAIGLASAQLRAEDDIRQSPITALAFTPDGKSLLCASPSGLQLLSWPDRKLERRLKSELTQIHDICFSPDGRSFAVGGGTPAEKGSIELRKWPGARLEFVVSPHDDLVYGLDFTADSARIASASYDRSVVESDARTGKELSRLLGHSKPVLDVCYIERGKKLVSTGVDGSLRLWDTAQGKLLRSFENHSDIVSSLAARPRKGEALPMVASASRDQTVRIWQPTIGRLVRFTRLEKPPLSIAWSSDGALLFAACVDGKIRVIDPETSEVISSLDTHHAWAYSIDVFGNRSNCEIAVGGRGGIHRKTVAHPIGRTP